MAGYNNCAAVLQSERIPSLTGAERPCAVARELLVRPEAPLPERTLGRSA